MISSANGPSVCIGIFFNCSHVPVKTFRALGLPTGDNTALGLPSEVMVISCPPATSSSHAGQRNRLPQFHHRRLDFRVFECCFRFHDFNVVTRDYIVKF